MKNINGQNLRTLLYLLLICVFLWVGLGPTQLGGAVSYVVINGNSMEPDFQVGDLVITRRSVDYNLDQRVVYKHPQIGYVFHRIVDENASGFILKGDNNDWLDTYQPSTSDILGKYWFDIPGAGNIIVSLRQPSIFVLFVLLISLILASIFLLPENILRKRKKGKRKRMNEKQPPRTNGVNQQEILLLLLIIAITSIIISIFSFSKPITIYIDDNITYKHIAEIEYSANDPAGIYDQPGVITGDPVYPGLECNINLSFSYDLLFIPPTGANGTIINGEITLRSEIEDDDGWTRTFLLIPEYKFSDTSVNAHPSLNICRILDLVAEKELKTGVDGGSYRLSILPEIELSGMVGGKPFQEDFLPEIQFQLDDMVFRVANNGEGLKQEVEGTITREREISNFIMIFNRQVEVLLMRRIAITMLGLTILAAIYPAWSFINEWKISGSSRIRIQHQPIMIDIKAGSIKLKNFTVIDLESITDLKKLAERYGAMMMHEVRGNKHSYLITDENFLYRFVVVEDPTLQSSPEKIESDEKE